MLCCYRNPSLQNTVRVFLGVEASDEIGLILQGVLMRLTDPNTPAATEEVIQVAVSISFVSFADQTAGASRK